MKEITQEMQQEVDTKFNEFWKELVCDKNGNLCIEKVKRELFDYSLAMSCVQEVYYELTDGATGDIHADPQSVIRYVRQSSNFAVKNNGGF